MQSRTAVLAFAALISTGCGGPKLDNGPTILGFTPALRAQMRDLVAANDPAADPDKVVNEYMDELKKFAGNMKIKPDAAGNYELPPQSQKALDDWLGKKDPGGIGKILTEFNPTLPKWIEPLVAQDNSGNISPQHREILVRYVLLNLQNGLSK